MVVLEAKSQSQTERESKDNEQGEDGEDEDSPRAAWTVLCPWRARGRLLDETAFRAVGHGDGDEGQIGGPILLQRRLCFIAHAEKSDAVGGVPVVEKNAAMGASRVNTRALDWP